MVVFVFVCHVSVMLSVCCDASPFVAALSLVFSVVVGSPEMVGPLGMDQRQCAISTWKNECDPEFFLIQLPASDALG